MIGWTLGGVNQTIIDSSLFHSGLILLVEKEATKSLTLHNSTTYAAPKIEEYTVNIYMTEFIKWYKL